MRLATTLFTSALRAASRNSSVASIAGRIVGQVSANDIIGRERGCEIVHLETNLKGLNGSHFRFCAEQQAQSRAYVSSSSPPPAEGFMPGVMTSKLIKRTAEEALRNPELANTGAAN
ncbi:hypothetical protein BC936DRAFT_140567, partial [Jimgerdemannia flammicorona]